MKGYSTATLVADELGRTLTAGQITQAEGLIEEAEAHVDRVTGRAWLVTSPVTDELHALSGPVVYLKKTPVAGITAVSVRSPAIGSAWTALDVTTGYELLDAANGVLTVSSYPLTDVVVNGPAYATGSLLRVTYTHTSPLPVPKDVQGVATRMVANRMRGRLDPSMAGVKSVSVGQGDLALQYRDSDVSAGPGLSDGDKAILRSYLGLVFA